MIFEIPCHHETKTPWSTDKLPREQLHSCQTFGKNNKFTICIAGSRLQIVLEMVDTACLPISLGPILTALQCLSLSVLCTLIRDHAMSVLGLLAFSLTNTFSFDGGGSENSVITIPHLTLWNDLLRPFLVNQSIVFSYSIKVYKQWKSSTSWKILFRKVTISRSFKAEHIQDNGNCRSIPFFPKDISSSNSKTNDTCFTLGCFSRHGHQNSRTIQAGAEAWERLIWRDLHRHGPQQQRGGRRQARAQVGSHKSYQQPFYVIFESYFQSFASLSYLTSLIIFLTCDFIAEKPSILSFTLNADFTR